MSRHKKKICFTVLFLLVLAVLFLLIFRMHEKKTFICETEPSAHSDIPVVSDNTEPPRQTTEPLLIDAAGTILKERIHTPAGYERVPCRKDSLTNFLRNYKMKRDGKPVLLYDGTKKSSQNAHAAILNFPSKGKICSSVRIRLCGYMPNISGTPAKRNVSPSTSQTASMPSTANGGKDTGFRYPNEAPTG